MPCILTARPWCARATACTARAQRPEPPTPQASFEAPSRLAWPPRLLRCSTLRCRRGLRSSCIGFVFRRGQSDPWQDGLGAPATRRPRGPEAAGARS
eukprot:7320976-Lingulodinium_polyedra.AAC.1